MFGQHLQNATVRRKVIVLREDLRDITAIGDLQHVLPAVGIVLVRAEEAKILAFEIHFHYVAEELAHQARRLDRGRAWLYWVYGVGPKVGHFELAEQESAIRVRVVAHAAMPFWCQFSQFLAKLPVGA